VRWRVHRDAPGVGGWAGRFRGRASRGRLGGRPRPAGTPFLDETVPAGATRLAVVPRRPPMSAPHLRDRRKRDMSCTPAAHVPFLPITATIRAPSPLVDRPHKVRDRAHRGQPQRHHSQSRGTHRSGLAGAGPGRRRERRANRGTPWSREHHCCWIFPGEPWCSVDHERGLAHGAATHDHPHRRRTAPPAADRRQRGEAGQPGAPRMRPRTPSGPARPVDGAREANRGA
jgi:hypothetical protein